jgi:hypothetical protein
MRFPTSRIAGSVGVMAALVLLMGVASWAAEPAPAQTKTGTIKSVDAAAKTFVLTRDPAPLTFTVDDKTTFTLDGKDSTFAAAVKADLAVTVTYTRNGDTRLATKVIAVSAEPAPAAAAKDVKVAVGYNDADHESAEFKFKEVPSPAKTTAATKAKIEIVDGVRDPNGAGVEALNDGKLPSESDEPAANFFFNAGTDGGRLLIDLGSSIGIKQVNTYSWHTDTRAPQVYTLYAAGSAATGFNAKPGQDVDPVKVGWTEIAKVDTRPKTGEPGGQYGVSISSTKGTLGQFRYLLIAASRTESDDGWGNTFFSEINVIDANKPEVAPAVVSDTPAIKTFAIEGGKYTLTINTSDTPDLTEWANKTLAPVLVEWYPKIIKLLPADGFTPPAKLSVTFKKNMDGVAYTTGHAVVGAEKYFQAHLGDVGAIVHELVHVVQQYHGRNNPGWLVEGVADYIRWFNYEPVNKRPRPNPAKAKYTDSYQVTAAFLDYVVKTHNKDLVAKLNVDMRNDKYTPDLWKTYTGKSVDELWDEYMATLKK